MSSPPPVTPHRIAIADIDIPFWRIVAILIKWTIAAIPAAIIVAILSLIIGFLATLLFGGMMGRF